MSIEAKGPGGVGNSYGRRTTNQPSLISSNKPKAIYEEFKNKSDTLTPAAAAAVGAAFGVDKTYLNAASAGVTGAWIPYVAGMRFAYALDSGSTTTTFSIDFSADGVASLGQAFTGTWASSSAAEFTPPIYLTNALARFVRFNVLTGGPLSVSSYI